MQALFPYELSMYGYGGTTCALLTLERRAPVVRRAAIAFCVVFGRAPDVPVALWVGFAGPRLLEPLVLRAHPARAANIRVSTQAMTDPDTSVVSNH